MSMQVKSCITIATCVKYLHISKNYVLVVYEVIGNALGVAPFFSGRQIYMRNRYHKLVKSPGVSKIKYEYPFAEDRKFPDYAQTQTRVAPPPRESSGGLRRKGILKSRIENQLTSN